MKCDGQISVKLDKPKPDGRGGLIYNIPINCGKCLNCKRNRVNMWSFRLMKEAAISTSQKFITLTYDTKYVPITENGFMTLRKAELQAFFKRLREYEKQGRSGALAKKIGKSLKYYAVGEYGTIRKRPHYHIILFNLLDEENIYKAWKFGGIDVQEANNNTIDYTLKYIMKKIGGHKFKAFDGEKEFSIMSKKLGHNWMSEAIVRHYRENLDINYTIADKGYKVPLSKYYRDKMLTKEEKNVQIGIIKRAVEEQNSKISEKDRILAARLREDKLKKGERREFD